MVIAGQRLMAEVSHSKFKSVLPLGTVENTVGKEALDPESEAGI